MPDYRFVTQWRIRAPIEEVWQALFESEKWPEWWRSVVSVADIQPGNADGIGGVRRYVWKSALPYLLAFEMEVTRVEAPRRLEGRASGELEGTGVWDLSEADGVTSVQYTWSVRTTRPWMNLLAPIARPVFAWNHDYVMTRGADGLARLLNAELVSK